MNCPKCSQQNPDDAQTCTACGADLSQEHTPKRLDVKTSQLAVASCILGVLSLPCFLLYSRAAMQKFGHLTSLLPIIAVACFVSAVLAVLLGAIALVCIEKSYGRLTGKGFAAIGIAIPLVAFFLTTAHVTHVTLRRRRSTAYRLYCGTNLSGIGKAMLVYANDYDDELPRAAGPNSKWGATPDWQADTRSDAFGLTEGSAGQASISASLFLLVKYVEITPKSFLCKGDRETAEFIPSKYGVRKKELIDLWEFGPDPTKHCSYTYHIPYGPYPLTASSDPGLAVAADRNPWLPSPGAKPRKFERFDPAGDRKAIKAGNTIFHNEDGQNVLFMDGHTTFEKRSFCGVNDDNIYTSQNATDIRKGALPTLTSQPAGPLDSLLVHDPPLRAGK
ncbi:MAG: hypothetical protein KAY65_14225 [Planctomycetes bacterium]|nr:hypothetical protein [Planctomycetota bacterium]